MPEGRREQLEFALGRKWQLRAAIVGRDLHGEFAVVIVGEGMEAHADLLQIIPAVGALGLELGFAKSGEQQCSEDGNDGNDDQ